MEKVLSLTDNFTTPPNQRVKMGGVTLSETELQEQFKAWMEQGIHRSVDRIEKNFSQVAILGRLLIGETMAKVEPFPDVPITLFSEALPEERQRLRNAMSSSVAQAKRKYGGEYSVEITECKTPRENYYHVVIVTRTA